MKLLKEYAIKPFELGEIAKVFDLIFNTFSCDTTTISINIGFNNGDLTGSEKINLDKLFSITNLDENTDYIYCSYSHFGLKSDEIPFNDIMFSLSNGCYNLHISGEKNENIYKINELFKNTLRLEEYTPIEEESIYEKLENIENRISLLERQVNTNKKLTCFVSMRFNEESELYFQKLEKFLTLLDINVLTGLPYEPRRITDKVTSKLEKNIDFVLYLVTGGSESFWTRDELVYGNQKGYFSIPLIEKGSKFNGGIFGDLEYIEFEKESIESSFIKLLEGINFIKNNIA